MSILAKRRPRVLQGKNSLGFSFRQSEQAKHAIKPAPFEQVEARREDRVRKPRNRRHGRPVGR